MVRSDTLKKAHSKIIKVSDNPALDWAREFKRRSNG